MFLMYPFWFPPQSLRTTCVKVKRISVAKSNKRKLHNLEGEDRKQIKYMPSN